MHYIVELIVDTDALMIENPDEQIIRDLIEDGLEAGLDAGTRINKVRERGPYD